MKRLASTTTLLLATATATSAHAQIDVNPPLPNVLILLDTSGSMENMLDNGSPESEGQSCAYQYAGNTVNSVTYNATTALAGTSPNKWVGSPGTELEFAL